MGATRPLCCKDIIKLFRINARSFLGSHYLVQDESWIPWDFEDNRRVWIATTAVKPTTPRPKLKLRKTMVIVAYTSQRKRLLTHPSTPRIYSELRDNQKVLRRYLETLQAAITGSNPTRRHGATVGQRQTLHLT